MQSMIERERRYSSKLSSIAEGETRRANALEDALKAMLEMHTDMLSKTNVGASFFNAEILKKMNDAPIQARNALALKSK